MTIFQFDECSSARGLLRTCKRRELAQVKRYPTKHKGLPDPNMLAIYTRKDGVIVTFDSRMADENAKHIPCGHPGIIMVGHSPDVPDTVTEKSATRIIDKFKNTFPDWHEISWSNCIVNMTNAYVKVGYISDHQVIYQIHKNFDDEDWQSEVRNCLVISRP